MGKPSRLFPIRLMLQPRFVFKEINVVIKAMRRLIKNYCNRFKTEHCMCCKQVLCECKRKCYVCSVEVLVSTDDINICITFTIYYLNKT